jgi:hypothetical protein
VIGLALLAAAAVQPPAYAAASASGSYRYWAFWEQSEKGGDWSYATQGPSVLRPEDGAAIGFRFSLSENSGKAAQPRGRTEFGDVCDGTDAKPGSKRIAVRIDFGTSAHAPPGEAPPAPRSACARVADDATAADALAEVAEPLRYNSAALLCAIEGYPKRGCGEQIADADKDAGKNADEAAGKSSGGSEGGTGSGTSVGSVTGVAAGLAAVAALAFAAVRRSRRRQ